MCVTVLVHRHGGVCLYGMYLLVCTMAGQVVESGLMQALAGMHTKKNKCNKIQVLQAVHGRASLSRLFFIHLQSQHVFAVQIRKPILIGMHSHRPYCSRFKVG